MIQLPNEVINKPYKSLWFHHHDANLPRLLSTGWERRDSPSYSWKGLERHGGPICILQHTLEGRGVLERHDQRHELNPGQAFLVEVPDDHHYYLPAGWAPWEFIYITFDGADLLRHAHWIIERNGPIITPSDPTLLPFLLGELYLDVDKHAICDPEGLSERVYHILMTLRRDIGPPHPLPPPPIANAMQYALRQFPGEIGVEEMALASGWSSAHFSRSFMREVGMPPRQYLTRVRLRHSLTLLRGTRFPLEEIARQCGFATANYFGKVFRKTLGITPIAYRQGTPPLTDESALLP